MKQGFEEIIDNDEYVTKMFNEAVDRVNNKDFKVGDRVMLTGVVVENPVFDLKGSFQVRVDYLNGDKYKPDHLIYASSSIVKKIYEEKL